MLTSTADPSCSLFSRLCFYHWTRIQHQLVCSLGMSIRIRLKEPPCFNRRLRWRSIDSFVCIPYTNEQLSIQNQPRKCRHYLWVGHVRTRHLSRPERGFLGAPHFIQNHHQIRVLQTCFWGIRHICPCFNAFNPSYSPVFQSLCQERDGRILYVILVFNIWIYSEFPRTLQVLELFQCVEAQTVDYPMASMLFCLKPLACSSCTKTLLRVNRQGILCMQVWMRFKSMFIDLLWISFYSKNDLHSIATNGFINSLWSISLVAIRSF